MKKTYSKPTAEKLAFKYRDQVVAASGETNWNNEWGSCFDSGDVAGWLLNAINLCEYID